MRDTRYYYKIGGGLGGFWSKCKDQTLTDAEAKDGRVYHKYRGIKEGGRWQHETQRLQGHIESCYLDNKFGELVFNLGLGHEHGVDVLKVKVYDEKYPDSLHKDFKKIALTIGNVSIDEPLEIATLVGTKWPKEYKKADGETKIYIPVYLQFYQKGDLLKKFFEYDQESKCYVDLPKPEPYTVGGKNKVDYTLQNEALIDVVKKFISDNQGVFDSRKGGRRMTPAESAKAEEEPITAFSAKMAVAQSDDDDDLPW